MKREVRAANQNQRQCNVNKLMTPEMRRQIRQLTRQLDKYDELGSEHYELMVTISFGLDTARDTARCLMARDPFDAWARLVKAKEEEFFGISEAEEPERRSEDATAKVTNLITMEMRQQQIREAKEKLEDYASYLGQFSVR